MLDEIGDFGYSEDFPKRIFVLECDMMKDEQELGHECVQSENFRGLSRGVGL